MREEIDFLKERAKEFWERTSEDIKNGWFNLCVLDIEQSVQLWLKYLIAIKAGDFPKTHYLNELISEVVNIYRTDKLLKFYKKNILQIRSLEDAYITSRYFPKKFSKDETKKLMQLAENLFGVLENVTKEKFI
jgi:HEPN domain-containing protein